LRYYIAHKRGAQRAQAVICSGSDAVHAKNHAAGGVRPALPELRLQVVDRNFAFRACNYSLYPSWLAYPWANAHLVIRGTHPYSIDRCDRTALRSEASVVASDFGHMPMYHEPAPARRRASRRRRRPRPRASAPRRSGKFHCLIHHRLASFPH